jgi:hypothetical protein
MSYSFIKLRAAKLRRHNARNDDETSAWLSILPTANTNINREHM